MNILCYVIVVPLFLLALYVEFFSFVVNVKRLVIPTYNVSGIPVVAVILYMLIGSAFSLLDTKPPFWSGRVIICLLAFHVLVHVIIPVLGYVMLRHRNNSEVKKL